MKIPARLTAGLRVTLFPLLSFILTSVLLSLPILRDFSYEFAVFYAVFLLIASSVFVFAHRSAFGPNRTSHLYAGFQILAICLIPVIGGLLSTSTAGFDCFFNGLRFFLLFAVPATVTGAGIAALSLLLSRKYAVFITITFYLLLLFLTGLEIYRFPQVYSFNPLIGFYPGVIYDEYLPLDLRHYVYRILAATYFLLPVIVLRFSQHKKLVTGFKLLFPTTGLLFYLIAPQIGIASSTVTLEKVLSKSIETEHFHIWLPENKFSNDELSYIKKLHEICYAELTEFFQSHPPGKITSFIFADTRQKYRLTGAGNADLAKPWLHQVYVVAGDYETSLKHELAHVFTADFGQSLFKLSHNFNSALLEGAATAADGFIADEDIDYLSFISLKENRSIDVATLFNGIGFFSANTSRAYALSGSFIKYMISVYGIQKFKQWYSSGFDVANYPKSLEEHAREFRNSLLLKEFDYRKGTKQLFFGTPPFLYKNHPRFIAAKKQEIDELTGKNKYTDALAVVNRLTTLSNEPGLLFRKVNLLDTLQSKSEAISILKNFVAENTNSPWYFSALLKLSDLLAKTGMLDSAGLLIKKSIEEAPNNSYFLASSFRRDLLTVGRLSEYLRSSQSKRNRLLREELNKSHSQYILVQLLNESAYKETDSTTLKAFLTELDKKTALHSSIVISLVDHSIKSGLYQIADELISGHADEINRRDQTAFLLLKQRLHFFRQ